MLPQKLNFKVHRIQPLSELEKLKMGCASSQGRLASVKAETGKRSAEIDRSTPIIDTSLESPQYPPAEAFEIPLTDHSEREKAESLIKKHPPKRLQRLTELPSAATTIQDLEEKLEKANIRREQYLQQRVDGLAKSNNHEDDKDEQGTG